MYLKTIFKYLRPEGINSIYLLKYILFNFITFVTIKIKSHALKNPSRPLKGELREKETKETETQK